MVHILIGIPIWAWHIILHNNYIRSPKDIYNNYKTLNWFGAIFLYLLWIILCPIFAFIGFMMWICTVNNKR